MGWTRHAHPNESSVGCVFCVPEVIFAEVSAVKSTRCPLCLPKLHAELVRGFRLFPSSCPLRTSHFRYTSKFEMAGDLHAHYEIPGDMHAQSRLGLSVHTLVFRRVQTGGHLPTMEATGCLIWHVWT